MDRLIARKEDAKTGPVGDHVDQIRDEEIATVTQPANELGRNHDGPNLYKLSFDHRTLLDFNM